MNAASTLTLQDYWAIALRRKWLILGTIVVCLTVAGVLCLALPKSYRSSTLILVEDQKVPEAYVKTTIGATIEERLTLIKQQMMSRTLLSRVIDEFKMYQNDVGREGLETVIEEMRKAIKVETVGVVGTRGKGVEAFTISFAHENPMTAMKVAAKLTAQFIEENLKVREELVEGATEFIEHELKLAKERLEQQEQLISEFKAKYMGELPQQTEANLRALDRLQSERNTVSDMLHRLTERHSMMQKAIVEYEATGMAPSALGAGMAPQVGMDPLVVRLNELERAQATLSAEYKDTYPDIVRLKQEIKEVKAQLAKKREGEPQEASSSQKRTYDPYLQGLIKERDLIKIETDGLKERQQRLTAQMKEYEVRVERAPSREQELTNLVRDYDNMQKNYQSLLDKKLNARVVENMEKRQKGEQFRIIDPANLPQKPEKPDRLRIMLLGLIFGCGLGMGGAVAMEHLKSSFRRPEEAELLLGLPVLAAIADFRMAYADGSALPQPLPEGEEAVRKQGFIRGHWSGKLGKLGKIGKIGRNGASSEPLSPRHNLVSKWKPQSLVAEQFRVAGTQLTRMGAERRTTVVVVTSAMQGEGKSATAVNLGYVLAQDLGKMTVLIDGDLKNPTLHSYAGVTSKPGLADLLLEQREQVATTARSPEDYLHRVGELPLWVLPTGRVLDRPMELSKIRLLADILSELRTRYEYIIVDAPPVLPLADMNVLGGMADVLALVIRAGSTPRDAVQRSLNTLKPKSQVGIVLTCVQAEGMPYYLRSYYCAQKAK